MRVTASSPDPIRFRAAATIRETFAPGEPRAMALRGIGIIPTREDIGADEHVPHGAEAHPARRERRAAESAWPAFVNSLRKGGLRLCNDAELRLWIPGLMLLSENTALGGERTPSRARKNGAQGHGRGFVQVRHAAKQEAQLAVIRAFDGKGDPKALIHRFTVPVRIEVLQVAPRLRIDPGNLYKKPLVDCLTERGGGLGIIIDDRRQFVAFEGTGYLDEYHGDSTPGVLVVLTPSHQSPRRAALPPGSPADGRSRRSSHGAPDPGAPLSGVAEEARDAAR